MPRTETYKKFSFVMEHTKSINSHQMDRYTLSRKKKMKKSKWNMRAVNKKDNNKGFDNGKNNLRKRVISAMFQFSCFALAGYMVYIQIKTYCANQDLSITTYKNFQNVAQDVFPTLTICAYGEAGFIFSKDKMPKNHSTSIYFHILRGNTDDRMNYSKILYDQVAINVTALISWRASNQPLKTNHLDPSRICISKEHFGKTKLAEDEYIHFNLFDPHSRQLHLDFYIHQKGQLLRMLKRPTYRLEKDSIEELIKLHKKNQKGTTIKKDIKLKVVSVDVLRKRANANDACDPKLENEDTDIRNNIQDAFGCIPAFTKPFLNQSLPLKHSSAHQTCNNSQYKKIEEFYEDFMKNKKWKTQPCTIMNSIVTMKDPVIMSYSYFRKINGLDPVLSIEFTLEYLTDFYKETVNKLAFDMATLWSQVGGFIGIFLGYSLLQIPELVKSWFRVIKSFF